MEPVRRWLGAGVALFVGAALLAPPVGAHAAATGARYAATDTISVIGADAACKNTKHTTSLNASGEGDGKPFPIDGVTREYHIDRTGTAGSSTTRTTAVMRGNVVTNAWGSMRAKVRATASASARPSGATVCGVSIAARAELIVDLVAPRRSWAVVRSTGRLSGASSSLGLESTDGRTRLVVNPGAKLTRLLPPGGYAVIGGVTASVSVPAHTTAARAEQGLVDATLAFYPIGTLRKLTGKARPFITAGNRDCSRKRVDLTLTKRAHKKARRITLTLNGKRVKVLTGKALRRDRVRVKRIPAKSAGVVRASVVLKSGAVRTMKTTSWPCS